MNQEKDDHIRVLMVGTHTGRISANLATTIAKLKSSKTVLVDFETVDERIKGIDPQLVVLDDIEFESSKRMGDLIAATRDSMFKGNKTKAKPLPYYHGKRRF